MRTLTPRTFTLPFSGLRLGWGRLEAVETGAVIPLDRELWAGLAAWLPYGLREWARTVGRRDIVIEGAPGLPKPYYLLWGVLRRAGMKPGRKWGKGPALSLAFTDTTRVGELETSCDLVLNGQCRDISKSRVAEVFEDVFGYPLAVDPTTHRGPMVVKGEENGVHDGRVVMGPCAVEPGQVYQRAVDNAHPTKPGIMADLRCPTVFGEIAVVCIKQRPRERRFDNYNVACDVVEPDAVFTADERAKITAFCKGMRLDWGGLDILRDSRDGRLYIVDVNKTDMPVLILSTREKLRVSDRLAVLLRRGVEARLKERAAGRVAGAELAA